MIPARLAAAVLLAALLAGCASRASIPEVVRVPVPVACVVDVPVEPDWATKDITAKSSVYEKVRALLAERRQRIAYEAHLKAALAACRLPVEPAALVK